MTWHAVYDVATGDLRSSGSVVADPLPGGLAVKAFPATPAPGFTWNPMTLDWDTPIQTPAAAISAVEFMQSFTAEERMAIRGAGDPILDDFLDLVRVAGTIRLDNPLVAQGLGYLVQTGILTAKRAAEIGGA